MRLISRAAAILRFLGDHPNGSSLGEIATATRMPRPTVQRLVAALKIERLVAAEPGSGARLGPEFIRLAYGIHRDATSLSRAAIERLSAVVEETVDLTVLSGGAAFVIDQVLPTRALRVVSQLGTALPLHCTASGKAHLSQLSSGEARAALELPLRRYTDRTTVTADDTLALVMAGSSSGCWSDMEEFALGVCAFALPIRGLACANFAVAVSLPSVFVQEKRERIQAALLACRDAIERRTGPAPPR